MGGQVFGFEHGGSRRYAELINRVFQMEGADAPLPPGFLLELDRPEWRILKRELWWSIDTTIAANVGNLGRLQIINPAGASRIVVVILMAIIQKAAAGFVNITLDGARIGSGIGQVVALDSRVPLSGASRLGATQQAVANNLPAISGTLLDSVTTNGANQDAIWHLPFVVLAPNTNVEITDNTANEAARFIAIGYERPATPDELAL